MLQSCVLGLARSITVSFFIESQINSQDRHSICNVNLFVDLVSMFVIDKSAIEPRLIRDCEAIVPFPSTFILINTHILGMIVAANLSLLIYYMICVNWAIIHHISIEEPLL